MQKNMTYVNRSELPERVSLDLLLVNITWSPLLNSPLSGKGSVLLQGVEV
jgi:hypothetical protein